MSNWNYDFSRDDVIAYLYAYIDAQTYSSYLTIEILLDEFKHHEPYFWLERLLFLMVKLVFILYLIMTSNLSNDSCEDFSITVISVYRR